MSTITYDSIKLGRIEADSLLEIMASPMVLADANISVIMHAATTLLASSRLKKKVQAALKTEFDVIDGSGMMVDAIGELQQKTQAIYGMTDKAHGRFVYWAIAKKLLSKACDNYRECMAIITRHDAEVLGIPKTDDSIDAIMSQLNQPKTRAMLEKSIAELNNGQTISGELRHD